MNQQSVLPPHQARDLFDRKAQALLNMSGEEFLRRWDAGEFRNLPESAESRKVMRVIALIPFGRRAEDRPAMSTTTVRSHSFVHKSDEEILEELRALRPKLEAGLRYLRNR